jgi:hypothetical protein
MKTHRYQTTDDVIARAQGRPAPPPHVPLQRFRSRGWVITGCIAGGLIMAIGFFLALGG